MPLIYSKNEVVTDIVRLLELTEPESGIIRGALYTRLPMDLLGVIHKALCLKHPPAVLRGPVRKAVLEKDNIEKALAACEGNRIRTAAFLGIGERTLYRKIKEYKLS